MQSGLVPGLDNVGTLFVDCFIDFLIPLAEQRPQRAVVPVITAESGERIVGIDINEHILADILKTTRFHHRFRQTLRPQ